MITWMEAARESVLIAAEIAAVKQARRGWRTSVNSMGEQAMAFQKSAWSGHGFLKYQPTGCCTFQKEYMHTAGARDENDYSDDVGFVLNDDDNDVTKVIRRRSGSSGGLASKSPFEPLGGAIVMTAFYFKALWPYS